MEGHNKFQEQYHQALIKEIQLFVANNPRSTISTIFLGGGTPSLYPLQLLKELFSKLHKCFDCSQLEEVTIESNPTDITQEKLETWRELGINRLSVGVQVLDDVVMKNLNRQQTTQDVLNAIKIAPKYFDNISVDLILGLPGVTQQAWENTINHLLLWPIKHISMYFLTVQEKTPLYFNLQKRKLSLDSEKLTLERFEKTIATFEKHGLKQYETSNYAQQGFESKHNQAYWSKKPYKGFGLGASSFDGNTRMVNEKNLSRYLKNAHNNSFEQMWETENLTQEQKKIETFMLGLRQTKGMDLHDMVYLVSEDQKPRFFKNLHDLKSNFLIQEWDGKISLTRKGMLLENEVIIKLM